MMSRMDYLTLEQVKRYLRIENDLEVGSSEEYLIREIVHWATDFLNWYKSRRYDIRRATLKFDIPIKHSYSITDFVGVANSSSVDDTLFFQEEYLLEVFSIINGNGSEIPSSDYILFPARRSPKTFMTLVGDTVFELDSNGHHQQVIEIDAFWGANSDAFINTLDALQLAVNETVDSFALLDVDGVNSLLVAPRIEPGMSLRIDDELLYVKDVDVSENTITVLRGFNGSVASPHALLSGIYCYRAPYAIEQACLRLVAWRYRQKDSDTFDKVYNIGSQTVNIPTGIPTDVLKMLGSQGQARIL